MAAANSSRDLSPVRVPHTGVRRFLGYRAPTMRCTPVLLAAALLLGGCVAPGADVPEDGATGGLPVPTFTPLETPTTAPPTPPPTSTTPAPDPEPTARPTTVNPVEPTPSLTEPAPSPTPAPVQLVGSIPDASGDLRGLGASQAPDHADLTQALLVRQGDRGTIRITFAGPAPESGEGEEILNVATYHDVTGDGRIDREIWASLTADGWGTSWHDLRTGESRYAADDEVEVAIEQGELVLTFPFSALADATASRWMAATQWGTGATLMAGDGVRDDAPDDRQGRRWPS